MYVRPTVLVDPPADAGPHRRLAAAVLRQALSDATHPFSTSARTPAREWLLSPANNERRFWCEVAGVDHDVFERHVHRHLHCPPRRTHDHL